MTRAGSGDPSRRLSPATDGVLDRSATWSVDPAQLNAGPSSELAVDIRSDSGLVSHAACVRRGASQAMGEGRVGGFGEGRSVVGKKPRQAPRTGSFRTGALPGGISGVVGLRLGPHGLHAASQVLDVGADDERAPRHLVAHVTERPVVRPAVDGGAGDAKLLWRTADADQLGRLV